MSSTCGLIVPSQQSKTTTLKLLNRFHQMTCASSLLSFFALFPPIGSRCLTTMKQCLAGRIRQERKTETEKRGRKREKDRKKKRQWKWDGDKEKWETEREAMSGQKGGGGELCVYMRRKMQDKGKYVWVKKLFLPSLEHLAVTAGWTSVQCWATAADNRGKLKNKKKKKKKRRRSSKQAGKVHRVGWRAFSK